MKKKLSLIDNWTFPGLFFRVRHKTEFPQQAIQALVVEKRYVPTVLNYFVVNGHCSFTWFHIISSGTQITWWTTIKICWYQDLNLNSQTFASAYIKKSTLPLHYRADYKAYVPFFLLHFHITILTLFRYKKKTFISFGLYVEVYEIKGRILYC